MPTIGRPLRLGDQLGRPRRRADGADLALSHKVAHGVHELGHVDVRVGSVHLVQVDPIGAESPEAALDGLHDPPPRRAPLVDAGAHRIPELRRQHDVVASPRKCPAGDLFGLTVGIHVGRVDEVDAGVQRLMDRALALGMVGVAPRAEHHGAEREAADLQAGVA